ncbi:hypothetical protein CR513_47850, partial [Mucuna pruriens]
MVSSMLPKHDTTKLINTSLIKDSGGARMSQHYKSRLKKTFEMTDLGLMNYFLGIEARHKRKEYLSLKRNILNLY